MWRFVFLISFFLSVSLTSQHSVRFIETDLETALSMAKRENKGVFVDTYASYCIPCKKLEVEFRDKELADYFNANFINVKINMEGKHGPELVRSYQIVFLPTLLFLNDQGFQRLKIDRLLKAKDLLKMAKTINGDLPYPSSSSSTSRPVTTTTTKKTNSSPKVATTTPKTSAPKVVNTVPKNPAPTQKEKITAPEGKILKIADSNNLPPEVLKEEAYYRMTKMDGSHQEAARKYLETQEDWLTDENINFLHDFLYSSRSKEFDFLIANREKFEQVIGEPIIAQSINILVNKELERAFPKPDLARAITLYRYSDANTADAKGHKYILDRLYLENDFDGFVTLGDAFFSEDKEHMDADLLYKYSSIKVTRESRKKTQKKCLKLAEKATEIAPTNYLYHYNVAVISSQLDQKKKATKSAEKALELCQNEENKTKVQELLNRVKKL